MRKEWILTEEEKRLKRRKIERNRLLKEQAQLIGRQQNQNSFEAHYRTNSSSSSMVEVCFRIISIRKLSVFFLNSSS